MSIEKTNHDIWISRFKPLGLLGNQVIHEICAEAINKSQQQSTLQTIL